MPVQLKDRKDYKLDREYRPRKDRNICRHCKLRAPHVKIAMNRGVPQGICYRCSKILYASGCVHDLSYKGFYENASKFIIINYAALAEARVGSYALKYMASGAMIGFLAVKEDSTHFVQLHGAPHLFNVDLYGMSVWLSNQNILMDRIKFPVVDDSGEVVPVEQLGEGCKIENVSDKLLMYDHQLKMYAVNKIKEEIAAIKILTEEKKTLKGKV